MRPGTFDTSAALALLVINHDSSFEMANDKAERVAEEVRATLGPEVGAAPERLEAVLDRLLAGAAWEGSGPR